jgi:hypothetical protein
MKLKLGKTWLPVEGVQYTVAGLTLVDWTEGDGTGSEGYRLGDYFDAEGFYRGPDQHGIEPIVSGPYWPAVIRCIESVTRGGE